MGVDTSFTLHQQNSSIIMFLFSFAFLKDMSALSSPEGSSFLSFGNLRFKCVIAKKNFETFVFLIVKKPSFLRPLGVTMMTY